MSGAEVSTRFEWVPAVSGKADVKLPDARSFAGLGGEGIAATEVNPETGTDEMPTEH